MKIKFNWLGVQFELPAACLRTVSYSGAPLPKPIISIGRKEVPILFKQYMKARYPDMLVWGKSSTFAGGNSADMWVCYPNGDELEWDSAIFRELNGFADMMKGGSYDGMRDVYEYGDNGETDNGTELEFHCKWVSFNHKAPFATWPDVKKMLIDMMAGKYVWGPLSLEDAIVRVKRYNVKDSAIQKALEYIGN